MWSELLLQTLINRALLKLDNFAKSDRKIGYAYFPTLEGMAEKVKVTARFPKIKTVVYDKWREGIDFLALELEKHQERSF